MKFASPFLTISLVVQAFLATGQAPFLRTHELPTQWGDSRVDLIHQSPRGYLWLAGEQGILRFDGLTYELYETEEVAGDVSASAILESSQQELWIGFEDGRLAKLTAEDHIAFWEPAKGWPQVRIFHQIRDAHLRPSFCWLPECYMVFCRKFG